MDVKISSCEEVMQVISQGGLNPHPVFPQWNSMDIYPNQFWGSTVRHKVKRKIRMIYLENEYLKIGFNLDIAGRVWSMYDKLAKRHAMEHASEVWSYVGGFAKSYTAGGMEVNYPRAHSATTRLPREHRTVRNADGSASVIISECERKWRTRWSITYTLRPGVAALEMSVRIYNRTPLDSRCMYWANCGIPLTDDTEYIIPEHAGAMHGREDSTFSWPMWRGKNQAFWKNTPEPLGLYMLEKQEPYFGYYDHAAKCGLAHYADIADLPGMKYWSWGAGWIGREAIPPTVHPDGIAYGEIQSGRVVIQEHLDRVPPETEQAWTEYWIPVRNTGRFHGAGTGAVISIKQDAAKGKPAPGRFRVEILGTGKFSAKVTVTCGACKPVSRQVSISPETVVAVPVDFGKNAAAGDIVEAIVTAPDGMIIGQARLSHPSRRDSWKEIPTGQKEEKSNSAEEAFFSAEALARDWMKHNDTREKYEKALAIDSGFTKAHIELAKMDIEEGQYESAVAHLKQAAKRDGDSLEIRYFMGLALQFGGNEQAACRAYELACRYDYENRARVRLAEMAMKRGDYHFALQHLERLRSMGLRLTRPRGLLAACLRHLNRKKEAAAEIKSAMEVDPMDPFLQIEAMLIDGKKTPEREKLLTQVSDWEEPIIEAAFDYGNAGLYDDALFALKVLPSPGALATIYRAWLTDKAGKGDAAKKILQKACSLEPLKQHPWRLEMFGVLDWAISVMPREARLYYYLGVLKMARDRTGDALALWEKAEKLGEKYYMLYASQGFYHLNVTKDLSRAMEFFRKAEKLNPDERYVMAAIGGIYLKNGNYDSAIKYLAPKGKLLKESFILASPLFDAYLATKQYDKIDDLCRMWGEDKMSSFTQLPNRFIQEGLELIDSGEYRRAIDILLKGCKQLPPCLNPSNPRPIKIKIERIYYHVGRCYEKLGQPDKAIKYWQDAVKVENVMAWERGYIHACWRDRYYQALCHLKLGNIEQANIIFDALDAVSKDPEGLPYGYRRELMDLVIRGRFAPEDRKDSVSKEAEIETSAEY